MMKKHFTPPQININGEIIGPGRPPLIVAEIGGNHGGEVHLAEQMIRAAADAGLKAVKFQAYHTAEFLSPQSPYFDELAAEELNDEQLKRLAALAKELGLIFGLSVFDRAALTLARDCEAGFIKISSGDLTHLELLSLAAESGLPLAVSTGASNQNEVDLALEALAPARDRLILMQCASLYPAPPEAANLAVMEKWLHQGLAAGYSDHCLGLSAAKVALTLGAVMLEKHFTTDPGLPGGDNSISARPEEMAELLAWAEISARLRGRPEKIPHPDEEALASLIRRAVVAQADIRPGHEISRADLALKRPPRAQAGLLGPNFLPQLTGRRARRAIAAGAPVLLDDLEADNG